MHQTIVITAASLLSLFPVCLVPFFLPDASKFNIGCLPVPFVTGFRRIVRQEDFYFTCARLNHCCHFPHHFQRHSVLCRECTSRAQWTIVERVEKWQLNQSVIITAAQYRDLFPFPLLYD